ncbi:HD domain-containing protein [bacterium]|nr:HD domain-containing protein [bacterium]
MLAIRDALDRHEGFAMIPYIPHPMEVCRLVLECGGSQIAACAAILHEAVGTGRMTCEEVTQRYGPEVSALVRVLVMGQSEGEDEGSLLLCADRTDHLLRRSQLGLGDCLARDLNELQLTVLRLGPQVSQVLLTRLERVLPALTPAAPRKHQANRKSGSRSSAA